MTLSELVKRHVLAVLAAENYNRKDAAQYLGVSSRTIDIWLSTWGLNKPPYRKAGQGLKRKNKTDRAHISARSFLEAP